MNGATGKIAAWAAATQLAMGGVSDAVYAQAWKLSRDITIVVGTAPGGGQDAAARALQRMMTERKIVESPITVINKPGGGGAIGWTFLNQHAGDAHYLQIANPLLVTNHIMGRAVVSHADVTPLATLLAATTAISVKADSPIKNGADLAERLKKDASSLSVSVGSSLGYTNHISVALITRAAGGDIRKIKAVVFQGSGEAMTALLGGHVDMIVTDASNSVPHLATGRIRVLGVASPRRLSGALAAIPTWKEQGIDVQVSTWRMVAGPRGMTSPQIAYWENAMRTLVATDEWKKDLERNLFEDMYLNSEDSRKFLRTQTDLFRGILTELGLAKNP